MLSTPTELVATLVNLVLALAYLTFAPVSIACFKYFGCDEDFDPQQIEGDEYFAMSYLRADYSIDCNEPRWQFNVLVAVVGILLYTFCVPALFGWLTWRQRHYLRKPAPEKANAKNSAGQSVMVWSLGTTTEADDETDESRAVRRAKADKFGVAVRTPEEQDCRTGGFTVRFLSS